MKPVVLALTRFYLPGFMAGGPIRTIFNMVQAMSDEFDFRIITTDRDLGAASAYNDVVPNEWVNTGHAQVYYVSPDRLSRREVAEVISGTRHDVLYLNSVFDPKFTIDVLINRRLGLIPRRPVVLASRGEFSASALKLKRIKKQMFLCVARATGLYSGVLWQASSESEVGDINRAWGGVSNVAVAPDLASPVPPSAHMTKPSRAASAPLRICTLSRISPMKNIDYALRVLQDVRVLVNFRLYGPVEDIAYWEHCKYLIGQLPANVCVEYMGPLAPEHVISVLGAHDLFFFPTRGESYGHVIHEALVAGLPVLVSDRTPWRQLERAGVGWDIDLAAMDDFVAAIEKVAVWDETRMRQIRRVVLAFAEEHGRNGAALEANRRIFGAMTEAGRHINAQALHEKGS